ncbi:BadF/BadG/BcrA/BcrD ATPase family protein [Desulfosporosinus sp. BG]|uniref:N-acetylglucosamine kinase n=1 Tax=Desulfosporosinus sp. BG TaxID=1633135 RepID=UPI00083A5C73|nr:BadF/BadG/BcrA/BcrD ATPase family protein [Desulfosporosinus sp. BG]ODA41379.1 Kinase [Desulfosporosinus sp. BG]
MKIKIGVDGGGSKTEIVALDQKDQVLRCLRKPASNYHAVGIEQAVQHIVEGIRDALQGDTLEGIGISLAGIDTPEDWNIMADGLKQNLKALSLKTVSSQEVPVVLENDAFGALMSVRGKFSGNVLASGTGAVALGVNTEGEVFRVGGWGHLIGDQGSGYDIGRKALAAAVASYDGYGPKSLLETKITEHLGLAQVPEISYWLYQPNRTNKEVAALVPVVVETARMGDYIAKLILDESGQALGLLTRALLRKTHGLEVGLVGGIRHILGFIEPSLLATIQEEFPTVQILKPNYPPSVGAALLSMVSQVRHIAF